MITTVMQGLWRATWQASLLVGVVMLVQVLLGKRLGGRGRHALWSVVLLRLLLPVLPPSPTSIHNLWRPPPASAPAAAMQPKVVSSQAPRIAPMDSPVARVSESPAPRASHLAWREMLLPGLAVIWLVGALVIATRIALECRRFARLTRGLSLASDPHLLEMVRTCAVALKVRRPLRALVGDAISTPAVTGVFRPTLLLPSSLLDKCETDERRMVILHELGHVKRHDVAANWVIALACVLHWFNPVVWFAASRMRLDRELACDELVLASVRDEPGQPGIDHTYGHTLVRLAELLSSSIAPPLGRRGQFPDHATVGILEANASLHRRIRMIAQFDPNGRGFRRAWTGAVLVVLALVALTDAVHGQQDAGVSQRRPAAATQEAAPPAAQFTDVIADGSQGNPELMQRLQKRLPEVRFEELPLAEALESLRKSGDLNMTVNWAALSSAGIDRTAPVSVQLKNVTIEQALDHALLAAAGNQVRLGYDTVHGALLVSTEEDLNTHTELRYYDVQDLLAPPAGRRATTQNYEDALIKMIQDVVSPDCWKDNGGNVGSIREFQGKLVIEATPRMHRQIEDLLSHLREPPTTQRGR
jgi:beta-lactamase regulating signal transducer with metallopeptidase domain